MLPPESARLSSVSADGSRVLIIEETSSQPYLLDENGRHILNSIIAIHSILGPSGQAFIDGYNLWGNFKEIFVGYQSSCSTRLPPPPFTSLPVWRADGRAMARKTINGVMFDTPEGCHTIEGATSAAFVGDKEAWSDGNSVWLNGKKLWHSTMIQLLMANGVTWLRSSAGFGQMTIDGVQILEIDATAITVWEMPNGVCIHAGGGVYQSYLPSWSTRCWHPNNSQLFDHPFGSIPVDVDLRYQSEDHTLHDLSNGTVRSIPLTFPINMTTRCLPDHRIRTFDSSRYWELEIDDTINIMQWGTPVYEDICTECSPEIWRYVWGI